MTLHGLAADAGRLEPGWTGGRRSSAGSSRDGTPYLLDPAMYGAEEEHPCQQRADGQRRRHEHQDLPGEVEHE